jgi:hypothetical protein
MPGLRCDGRIQIRYTLFTFGIATYQTLVKKIPAPMTQPRTASASNNGYLDGSADSLIRAFLTGESDGHDVLNALYGDVLDEPIPQRLRDLLKR